VEEEVRAFTRGRGADLVFETAGSVQTAQLSVEVARRGGKVVLVGLPSKTHFDFGVIRILDKELDILGVFRYANMYKGCVDLLNARRVNLATLITHRFPLEKTQEALLFAHEHKAESIKVVVNVGG
jgi:L-iditol 2-dehydrogenase